MARSIVILPGTGASTVDTHQERMTHRSPDGFCKTERVVQLDVNTVRSRARPPWFEAEETVLVVLCLKQVPESHRESARKRGLAGAHHAASRSALTRLIPAAKKQKNKKEQIFSFKK